MMNPAAMQAMSAQINALRRPQTGAPGGSPMAAGMLRPQVQPFAQQGPPQGAPAGGEMIRSQVMPGMRPGPTGTPTGYMTRPTMQTLTPQGTPQPKAAPGMWSRMYRARR